MEQSLASSPAVAIWELTRACRLACRHCRASAMPARDPRELSRPQVATLLDQLGDLAPGVLVLTGGDPLEHPDLFDIVEGAVRRRLTVAIAPSVTPLLTDPAIRALADRGVHRVALSLDGPDAATHDGLRGIPGSFERTLRAMDAVRAADLPLQVNTSLTPATLPRLAETADVVARIAPALWSVFFVVPVGRARAEKPLDPAACEEAFHLLYEWGERTGLPVKTTAAPAFRRVVLQREAARTRTDRRQRRARRPAAVNDGKGFLFISHTGEVFPSGFLPLGAGNVRDTPIADIYRQSALFRHLRDEDRLEGKCAACPFKSVCGGSRARAFAMTGNPFAEDPACVYQPPPATSRASAAPA